MYKEYAIDPGVIQDFRTAQYLLCQFGWSKGILLSEYPKKWIKKVYDNKFPGPIEKKKVEVLLTRLKSSFIRRSNTEYNENKSWLNNVITEHGKLPFYLIISNDTIEDNEAIISVDDSYEYWDIQDKVVSREANEYADVLSTLLQVSEKIMFVDPYFDVSASRFRNTLIILINKVVNSVFYKRKEPSFELHTSISNPSYTNEDLKRAQTAINNINSFLSAGLSDSLKISIYIWREKKTRLERFHNRYILTENSGVKFGTGLDERANNSIETDDLNRLSSDQHSYRLSIYSYNDKNIYKDKFDLLKQEDIEV